MQERALRTRHALMTAAAEQFDRCGYAGTSLARVSKTVDMTMGALTFHFRSKCDLANVVEARGRETLRAAVAGAVSSGGPALRRLSELLLELARLLEQDVVVRATVRLSTERGTGCWSQIWLPEMRKLLQEASDEGQLKRSVSAEKAADMIGFLLVGMDANLRAQDWSASTHVTERLEQVWQLTLAAISAEAAAD
ncbi:ScbR family autoregulator-binding transcription factor [Streptomyces achromogenes]|jgi:AcrR family transcriptional regulator|uniref:ScbR family autoregulator-binding transcription factor n=1 Tax=Streptomyces achromogenes TaxID=67255 RepID=UPI0004CB1B13|nr:ScbR family autoregulator-binding transcription factor [Streptomyces achromogenes]MCZ0207410.1 ScbR family autoregulator-binding transcription factor [Streptomyces sp. UMAF16]